MTGLRIPFTGLKKQYSNLRTEILDVTDEVYRSGQLMDGNYTAEFENWLAKRNGSKYAIPVILEPTHWKLLLLTMLNR